MDGKSLKQFVENDQTWSKFVNERFAMLNKSHTGKLTHTELEPAIAGVGSALGLPPLGTDAETDHIYTEVPLCDILHRNLFSYCISFPFAAKSSLSYVSEVIHSILKQWALSSIFMSPFLPL